MKQFYLLLVAIFMLQTSQAQIIDIPDANFKDALINTNCVDTTGNGYGNIDADTNDDGEIDVSEAEAVISLTIPNKNISSLTGIENFTNLERLDCHNNSPWLNQNHNVLETLDLSSNLNLKQLRCSDNLLNSIDLSQNIELNLLAINDNNLTSVNINGLANLHSLWIRGNSLSSLNVNGLSSLNFLDCSENLLTSLDLSGLTSLSSVKCNDNQLISLNLNGLINLSTLNCYNNNLTSLDFIDLNSVVSLLLYNNQLTTLNVSNCSNLESINCRDNQLTSLNLSGLGNLTSINCKNNLLTQLEVNHITSLRSLYCQNNLLTTLETNGIDYLKNLNCSDNQLVTLYIKDGQSGGSWEDYNYISPTHTLTLSNNPNMEYVCVDPYGYEGAQVASFLGSNAIIGSYCSFVPGGTYYTLEGENRIDMDSNGCDSSDASIPYLKYTIENGSGYQTGTFTSNVSGYYSFPVQAGTHTIAPIIENPDYFTISPTSVTVDFPTDSSPNLQDFCLVPNGVYDDLEVSITPIELARPGFDVDYKIIYKNKATTTLSGSIDLNFEEDVMDFLNANPTVDSQSTGNLSWNFSNLLPLETREILFTMNLNTPTDTPALNGGDVLSFTATTNPLTGDETPEDNVFTLNQTVVNSYDPNDKTCLEGDTITPELVGKNVHYLIRFENTGSANAINVVVKDEIDISKFDISTLFLTDASHDVVTRIKDGNVVEFIFENINLPFDDANNDGYIAFKIKTLSTLVVGDTFDNHAEIYFDFNFPIITNNAVTSVEEPLSIDTFELIGLEVYPNPVQDVLQIKGKDAVQSVTVYDISGRLINQVSFIGNQNDVSISTEKLSQGTYFVKVRTTQGEGVKKVVKE